MSLLRKNDLFPGLNFFDDFLGRDLWSPSNHSSTSTTIPSVNIRENNENFEVEMAAPGMNKNDFKIELDGNMLTISSERRSENEHKDGERYTRREFSYQSFERTFQLYKDVVDADRIQATYENGVLHLTIPKKEEAKQRPPRTIQIN